MRPIPWMFPFPFHCPWQQVVVDLILNMHHCGHPAYTAIDEETMRRRAADLPEKGIPPEVWKVVHEAVSSHDKLQPQKAATPCDAMEKVDAVGKIFSAQRARAIVAEGESREEANARELAALKEMENNLLTEAQKEANAALLSLEVHTGNKFLDQFRPEYFAVAFPFCFKYGTACPDIVNATKIQGNEEGAPTARGHLSRRHAGNPEAPHVGIREWAAAMARRVETQFRRDWTFGFTLWNYLFRTMVNLQRNAYMYAVPDPNTKGGKRLLGNDEIGEGFLEVMQRLRNGMYTDVAGALKPVNGDLTKLRHAPGLTLAAQKALCNTEARTRRLPGTHEIRKTMRHQTNANRVVYGTAIFITFSPREQDSSIMMRLVRARQSDPAVVEDGSSKFQKRQTPALDVDYVKLSAEALAEEPVLVCQRVEGSSLVPVFLFDLGRVLRLKVCVAPFAACTLARSCCLMTRGKRCLPGILWPARKGFKP